MAHCLSDTRFGYYRRARLGEDFITAPMLSNALGVAVGSWFVACWRRLGCPREIQLVEAGGGRFELLEDVLGVMRKLAPESLEAMDVHAVEIGEGAQERLAQKISRFGVREARVFDTLEEVPQGRWLFFANEFFDALPIRQFLWSGGRTFVRRIALDEEQRIPPPPPPPPHHPPPSPSSSPALRFVRGEPSPLPRGLLETQPPSQKGERGEEERIVELSPRALFLAATVASQLAENGGAAFVCDYGYLAQHAAPRAGSLQAFYKHKAVDPLTHIGACDLSAEVDFGALLQTFAARLGESGKCRVQTQRTFLQAAGVEGQAVSKGAQGVVRRLVDADAMGEKFKVLTAFVPHPLSPQPAKRTS